MEKYSHAPSKGADSLRDGLAGMTLRALVGRLILRAAIGPKTLYAARRDYTKAECQSERQIKEDA